MNHAIAADNWEGAYILLAYGSNPNEIDHNGCTVIINVSIKGNIDMVIKLVKDYNVDINQVDNKGNSGAIVCAAMNNHWEVVKTYLEDFNANPNRK
jgi:ankyrin repeat protein